MYTGDVCLTGPGRATVTGVDPTVTEGLELRDWTVRLDTPAHPLPAGKRFHLGGGPGTLATIAPRASKKSNVNVQCHRPVGNAQIYVEVARNATPVAVIRSLTVHWRTPQGRHGDLTVPFTIALCAAVCPPPKQLEGG